jgi:hypothetical protein
MGLTQNLGLLSTAIKATSTLNVGIGTNSPDGKLHIYGKTYARYGQDDMFAFYYDDNYRFGITNPSTDLRQLRVFGKAADGNSFLVFATGNDTERMRITSGGNVGIGTTAPDFQLEVKANTTNYSTMVKNSSATTPNGLYIYFDASSSSNTSQQFLRAESTAGHKAAIYTNGTFGSATSTYGGISDIKLKENIKPATSKLNDLLKVNVVNYNFIDDTNKEKQIGVIAQELESIFPNLVFETIDDKTGESTKSVKYSIFIPMLIKAIQELKAELDALKNK